MNFSEELLINTILLLFPIFVYLLYVAYSNNVNKKKNDYILDIANIISLYLLIKYRIYFSNIAFLLLINIPLILCLLKKRYKCAFILTIIIIIYHNIIYDINLLNVSIEYIVYFLFFIYFNTKKKNYDFFIYSFIFLKGIILSFEIFYLIPNENNFSLLVFEIFLILLVFYVVSSLSVYLLEKGEQILSLNNVLKELEKEKVLRNSLFKITHEVKNPIAVCKGYLDMMDYDDVNKIKKYNGIIKSEINRTLNIMDDFLDYTKIKVFLEPMDIVMLLEDTLMATDTLLETNNIKMITDIPEKEIYIKGDYNKLKQVFVNVIKNSIEAMEDKKGFVKTKLKEDKNKIIITIEDNGKGMNKETLTKVNEMFFTTKEKGTGLGVPLSNEIIKLHNGKMKYESIENKKTKVTITLHKFKNI